MKQKLSNDTANERIRLMFDLKSFTLIRKINNNLKFLDLTIEKLKEDLGYDKYYECELDLAFA